MNLYDMDYSQTSGNLFLDQLIDGTKLGIIIWGEIEAPYFLFTTRTVQPSTCFLTKYDELNIYLYAYQDVIFHGHLDNRYSFERIILRCYSSDVLIYEIDSENYSGVSLLYEMAINRNMSYW